jgi:hypothetical protein
MLIKAITWFGKPAVIVCDGECSQAWGINHRPRVQLSDDPDDYEFLADGELGEAPRNSGTYEGQHGKPSDYSDPDRQNKWCCRECERSAIVEPAGVVVLPDYGKRVRNMPR